MELEVLGVCLVVFTVVVVVVCMTGRFGVVPAETGGGTTAAVATGWTTVWANVRCYAEKYSNVSKRLSCSEMFIKCHAYLLYTSSCQGRGSGDRGSCKYILGNADSLVEPEDTNTHSHRSHSSLLHTSSYLYSKPTVRQTCKKETMRRSSVVTVGLNSLPLGCLRLWYNTISLGFTKFSTTFVMFFPVRRFALRMLPLDVSVQNTFSCVTQYIRARVKTKDIFFFFVHY